MNPTREEVKIRCTQILQKLNALNYRLGLTQVNFRYKRLRKNKNKTF